MNWVTRTLTVTATGVALSGVVALPASATTPTLAVHDVKVVESGTYANFKVVLSHAASRKVTFTYATANGTARAGHDYLAKTGTAVIPAGQTSTIVPVAILDDFVVEPAETFKLKLPSPVHATVADGSGAATIRDNDGPVINEIMADPAVVADSSGEWVELYNYGASDADLTGWTLTDSGGTACHLTGTDGSGNFFVIAPTTNSNSNGGLTGVDSTCALTLANAGDVLKLRNASGVLIDIVDFTTANGFTVVAGKSLNLDPDTARPGMNDTPSNWCYGSTPYGAGNDMGTPAQPNLQCGAV